MKNLLANKKPVFFSVLIHQRLEDGIKKIKSKLLELHPTIEDIISLLMFKIKILFLIYIRQNQFVIVESHQKNNLMILIDKFHTLKQNIQLMILYQMLVPELILKEKVCVPFWNKSVKEMSMKLSLPTKTDCVDSDLTLLNGSVNYTTQKLWFSTKQIIPRNKNCLKTLCPSYTSSLVNKWEKENIKLKSKPTNKMVTIRCFPSKEQKKILIKWTHTYRSVYNKTLELIEKYNEPKNFYSIRNKIVPKKNIDKDKQWLLETPKDIRANSIKEAIKNYKSCFSNLKNKNIKFFKMKYKQKKEKKRVFTIPKTAIKQKDERNVLIYSTYIKEPIKLRKDKYLKTNKLFKYDGINIVSYDFNKWYIQIPIECVVSKRDNQAIKTRHICALDPGVKSFQTIYSTDNKMIKIGLNDRDKIQSILKRIYKLQSKQSEKSRTERKKISKQIYNRFLRINNMINEMHWKTINYLTSNYDLIYLPSFETQCILKKLNHKESKEILKYFQHFKFKERLKFKTSILDGKNVSIIDEFYTSKTCTSCGNIQSDLGNKNIYNCKKCKISIDRDLNGARNILLKHIVKIKL